MADSKSVPHVAGRASGPAPLTDETLKSSAFRRNVNGNSGRSESIFTIGKGLDHKQLTFRFGGRDVRLTDIQGEVVHGILA
jgi:hypothetical protein